jgi:hypothetical protein
MSAKAAIPRPVWFLGLTSLFTDAATEMIYPLLPGLSVARPRRVRRIAWHHRRGRRRGEQPAEGDLRVLVGSRPAEASDRDCGLSLSSLARPFIAITTTWPQVLIIRALDRVGKGIRGAPRDVLLARFATPTTRGRIYGFIAHGSHRRHRRSARRDGDLFFAPERYRLLFALTAIPGAIAVALLFLVDEDAGRETC